MLTESELYLFTILLNYGKESHPKNEVLKAKTGWAMNKLQATKKSLVDKGLLKVVSRYIGAEGKRVNSNEYRITTRLASKYNGKKVIYGETTRLSSLRLEENQITFKQTPYDIKAR